MKIMRDDLLSNHHIVLWGIFLVGLILRGYGLSSQPPLDDEAAAASAAYNYLEHGLFGQVMWYHPPLRNFVIFVSGKLFGGYTAWGLRGGSVLLGSLSVPLLGYLAFSLFRKEAIAYLAAFFLCIDPLHIALSREAFQETTTAFFIIAGVLAALYGSRKDNIPAVYLSGLFFGLATASKWHGLFPWAACAFVYLFAPRLISSYSGERRFSHRLLTTFAAFVAIPAVVYVVAYLPWLLRGYSLSEFADLQAWLVKRQYFHEPPTYAGQFLQHRAYQWFIMPTAWIDFVFHEGRPYIGIAMGNFLVWVMTLPALYFSVKRFMKEREFEAGFAIGLFVISYLPLVFTSRGIWVFSAPAVIPFAFILTAFMINAFLMSGRLSFKLLCTYLAVVLLLSALMYPMAIFRTLEYPYLKSLSDLYSPHKEQMQ